MPPEELKYGAHVTKDKQKKDRKMLNPQAKELILNVVNFMKREACGEFIIPARKVQCRAAVATGFSERTVRRIVKESKSLIVTENLTGEGMSTIFPPKKKPRRPRPKTGLDELTRSTVRKIIHSIYANEKTVPTIKKIHQKLIHEIDFKGSSRSTHKIIKDLGFYWKKTNSKSFVLLEKHEIRIKRIEFLRDIDRHRREGRPIVYIGDTSILTTLSSHKKVKKGGERLILMHAGGEIGFIPNALTILQTTKSSGEYHQELSRHYHYWVENTLIPALPPTTVLVIDSTTYHNIHSEKIPALDANTEQMKQWLHARNVNFTEGMLRPELYLTIKKHASKLRKQKSIFEQKLVEKGHFLLKLPPHHPDLNPINHMWADLKCYVTDSNISFEVNDIKMLCQEKLNELGMEALLIKCRHVKDIEQQYLENEELVDYEIGKIVAKPVLNKETNSVKSKLDNDHFEGTDEHNINFVRHFMGGFLGLEDYKTFNC